MLEQLLRRNVKRFRGGLVFKAHRLLYHSTLGLRVKKKVTCSRVSRKSRVPKAKRERERERQRARERESEKDRERERQRARETERDREREKEKERARQTGSERDIG